MAVNKPQTARTIAAEVLNRFDSQRNYAGQILNKLLRQTSQKQQTTDLVFGCIRNLSAIDIVISELADCPTGRIPSKLLNIIRIGVYELIFSTQTAEYAVVNEAVENTRRIAGKKQTGFVNALLRQIIRHIKNRQAPLCQNNIRSTVPQSLSTGCEFDRCFLPAPKISAANYFSKVFSLPEWLVDEWLSQFGREKTRQICFASNRRPGTYLRPNPLKTTMQKFAEKLRQADIEFEIVPNESMIKIKSPRAITALPGYKQGLFTVQDITASQAVKLLRPQRGDTILDICAAPGTKTIQLAQATKDKAKIIATDIDAERLKKVKENIVRLSINSVKIIPYAKFGSEGCEKANFDCILLDVPCSNTGVLARRPEVRFRIKPQTIIGLAKIQLQLLQDASAMIKPGGKICYSTCSIQMRENSELVRRFLKSCNFKLESELLVLPQAEGFDRDGGYVAILRSE